MPTIDPFPSVLPIFPLAGALLLPQTELPLNVFEPRYMAMVNDVLGMPHRMIGMVQPRRNDGGPDDVYQIGCAGRITSFHETNDGRYLMTLWGVQRFRIVSELPQKNGYRHVIPDFSAYERDHMASQKKILDRTRLMVLLKEYFKAEGLTCNWDNVDSASDDMLISALSMACPLDPSEKQALLEAQNAEDRGDIFMSLLEMAVAQDRSGQEAGSYKVH